METLCVVVPIKSMKDIRKCLTQLEIYDPSRRLQSNTEDDTIALPIDASIITDLYQDGTNKKTDLYDFVCDYLKQHLPIENFSVVKKTLPLAKRLTIKKPEVKLKESLQKLCEKRGIDWSKAVEEVPSHWERHGDLVLIPSTSFTSPVWIELGNELWECVTSCLSCKRVAVKDVVTTNGYRSPQVRMVYRDNTWVIQTDNGIKYTYDIKKCMFSSGNITEKLRVAKFDCTGEIVVDLYAGIGYFTLPYLVYTNVKHLHACEWNPDAVEALRKNLTLNGVQDRCTIHEGDNRKTCPTGIADRVNLGLIPSCREGWPVACAALNSTHGGILHIHHNVNTKQDSTESQTSRGESTEQPSSPRDTFLCEAKLNACENGLKREILQNDYCENGRNKNSKESLKRSIENCEQNLCTSSHSDPYANAVVHDKNSPNYQNTYSRSYLVAENNAVIGHMNSCEILNSQETNGSFITDTKYDVSDKPRANEIKNIGLNLVSVKCDSRYVKWLPWAQDVSMEIRRILEDLHKKDWKTSILHIEHVKSYAPHVDHVVLDLDCRPSMDK